MSVIKIIEVKFQEIDNQEKVMLVERVEDESRVGA